jgi:predicted RNA binding protein YcfA (HicA-like mRNA interferase family)
VTLPVVCGARVVTALEKAGFVMVRTAGSHHIMAHPDGRRTSIPVHAGRVMRPGTLRNILRDVQLSVSDLERLL